MRPLVLMLALGGLASSFAAAAPPAGPPVVTTGTVVAAYGAGAVPAGANDEVVEAVNRNTAKLAELLAEIKGLRADMAGKPKAAPAKLDPRAVASARCSSCHTPGRADDFGGGFALFADDDGKALAPLDARKFRQCADRVEAGTMPPKGKVPAAEKDAMKDLFTGKAKGK